MHAGTKGSLPTTYFAPPKAQHTHSPSPSFPLPTIYRILYSSTVVAPSLRPQKNELKAPAAGGGGEGGIGRKVSPAHTTFFFPLPPSLPYAVGPLFN